MAADPKVPPAYPELGKVLRDYMIGVQPSDLSRLSTGFAEIVQKVLAEAS
ncbi:hypothetical protein TFLX_06092 [Thermoflexales bacterium]|nr:hypothetical protein TFLX_06092 [Thermoflexales bacterium]